MDLGHHVFVGEGERTVLVDDAVVAHNARQVDCQFGPSQAEGLVPHQFLVIDGFVLRF